MAKISYIKKSHIIFLFLVGLELVCALGIGGYILLKKNPKQMVTPINKDALITSSTEVSPYFFELNPNNPEVVPKPTWLPVTPTYNITKSTMNDRYEYEQEKPLGTFRIMTIGDSFTFGWNVDVDKNYSEKLEDLLNEQALCKENKKYEVLNLGVPGYDIAFSVMRYIKRGAAYNPDILIFYVTNDFVQYESKMIEYQKNCMKKNTKPTQEDSQKCWDLALAYEQNIPEKDKIEYQMSWLERLTKIFDGPIIIVTNPRELLGTFAKTHPSVIYYDKIKINTDRDKYTFREFGDAHPNVAGHEQLAIELLQLLSERDLLKCSGK